MGRTKGSKNKKIKKPEVIDLPDSEKLAVLADILLEVIFEEGRSASTN